MIGRTSPDDGKRLCRAERFLFASSSNLGGGLEGDGVLIAADRASPDFTLAPLFSIFFQARFFERFLRCFGTPLGFLLGPFLP